MSDEKIKELEERFYEECTNREAQGQYMLVNKVPKEVFQWIVNNVIKAKEEHECKFYVNADWTYLRCECGKRKEPSN